MELETIEAAAAFEKENRLGGGSMASAVLVLSTVEFYSTSAVETDAPLRTAAPQIVQLSRPNNHAVVNCCHILF